MVRVPVSEIGRASCRERVWVWGGVGVSNQELPQQLSPQSLEPSGLYTVVAYARTLACDRVMCLGCRRVLLRVKAMFWPGTVVLSAAVVPALVGVIAWVASGGTS